MDRLQFCDHNFLKIEQKSILSLVCTLRIELCAYTTWSQSFSQSGSQSVRGNADFRWHSITYSIERWRLAGYKKSSYCWLKPFASPSVCLCAAAAAHLPAFWPPPQPISGWPRHFRPIVIYCHEWLYSNDWFWVRGNRTATANYTHFRTDKHNFENHTPKWAPTTLGFRNNLGVRDLGVLIGRAFVGNLTG